MLSVSCIAAQRCHTAHCPASIATQNKWLMRGLDPQLKSVRLANYVTTLRKEIIELTHACGVDHPAHLGLDDFSILDDRLGEHSARAVFGYEPGWGVSAR